MKYLILTAMLFIITDAVAAPVEVTIEEMNKARDAHVQAEKDTALATADPDTMTIDMGGDRFMVINKNEPGFAAILSAVKAAAATRAATPKDLPVIIKEEVK